MKNFTFRSLMAVPLFVMGIFIISNVYGQTIITNPASPFVVPAGVTQIKVEAWGGGGGGGGVASSIATYGSGGGGGAYNSAVISVSSGQSYTITIGAGGNGVSNAAGLVGTASVFSGPGGSITANPGGGGAKASGPAGAGGTGILNGGAGGVGGSNAGAGGGGGAGNAGAGAAGTTSGGGAGGIGAPNIAPYIGGAGAGTKTGTSGSDGNIGNAPGGGGGGAYNTFFNGNKAGGKGGAGQVVITYCQTYSLTSTAAVTPRCVTNANSTVTLNGNLPVGNYIVTYNRSLPAATGLTATMNVTTANTGTFVAAGLSTVGSTTITVTAITSAASTFCSTLTTVNNTFVVVINGAATVSAGVDQAVCGNASASLAGAFGGTATSATWTTAGSGTFTPGATTLNASYVPSATDLTTGSAVLTLTTNNPTGACLAVSDAVTVTVKKIPSGVSITPPAATLCVGNSQLLTANATIESTGTLSSENFNTSGSSIYTAAGTTNQDGSIFTQRTSPYAVNGSTITNNDASRFMIAAASVGFTIANSTTNSTLTSPVINTTAYSSLSLGFRHSYSKGNEAGVSVQISTNGGTSWSTVNTAGIVSTLNTFTVSQGADNDFVDATINLTPFINQANFRIRFNYAGTTGTTGLTTRWWAIDDVLLNGTPLPVYSWTANTAAGINGLPAGSGTPSVSLKTRTVNPTQTTIYTLTVSDAVTNCAVSTATSTVTVNQNSTIALSSGAGSNIQTVCQPAALNTITYAIGGGGTGASITAGALPAGLSGSYTAGVFTISGTPTQTGNFNYTVTTTGPCVNVSLSGAITVNSAPGLTCPGDQTINADPGLCSASASYSAAATGFPAPGVSYLVNGDFIDFPYDFPVGTTTVTVLAEGACAPDATCSFTVTVNDLQAPIADIATLPDLTGECSATATIVPTATDVCDGIINGTTTDPLTYSTQGSYTITWTFTDTKGNSSSQTQTVIVNDVTAPVITCPAAQAFCSTPANIHSIPLLIATDNCTVGIISYSVTGATTRSGNGNDASGNFNVGVSTIEWTVTDGNNNVSSCSTAVTVNLPPVAPTFTGIVNVCPYLGTDEELTYTAFSATATSYNWVLPPNVVLVSGQGTATLVVKFNVGFANQANKQFRVTASSVCGTSPMAILYLLTQFPATPGVISGPVSICDIIGTATTATYKINKVTAATSYAWTTQAVNTTVTHPAGTGINDTVIVVTYGAGYTSSPITVAAVNGCGTSGSVRSLNVPRNPSSAPGLISGPTNVCANLLPSGSAATYSINALAGATAYTWSAPAGSNITHVNPPGANDLSITVQFPAGMTNGTVSVSATNGCGTSNLRTLAVTKLSPAAPGVIDVIQLQQCPERLISYTISSVPANASSLLWNIPSGAGISIVDQTPNSITVSYPSSAVQGTVTVQAVNSCGSSSTRTSAVKLAVCAENFAKAGSAEKQAAKAAVVATDRLDVRVFPNPTTTDFKIQVSTLSKEPVSVRILDIQGRVYKNLIVQPFELTSVGADLQPGSYVAEVIQGKSKNTQKLVKF